MKRALGIALFAAGLITLLGLGHWQYQRLHWKNGIIADLQAQYDALEIGAKPLTRAALQRAHSASTSEKPLLVGRISGRMRSGDVIYLGPRSLQGNKIYDIVVPIDIDKGTILTHLGYVAENKRGLIKLPSTQVDLLGVARLPDYSRFISGNSPQNDIWFHIDIHQMAQARQVKNIAPLVFFAAQASPSIDGITMPEQHWYPRNKHAQYMIFWFGMAFIWCGIFAAAFWRSRHEKRAR
jgi:surfeit locus 1 family protein